MVVVGIAILRDLIMMVVRSSQFSSVSLWCYSPRRGEFDSFIWKTGCLGVRRIYEVPKKTAKGENFVYITRF